MSSSKRCRCSFSPEEVAAVIRSAPKRHRPNRTTPILRLSDELFLRIASFLHTRDLASFQRVSHRCARIAGDGLLWKALYYRRYVRPRASRIPGVGRGELAYSSRRSRWLEDEGIAREVGTNWKALYRLQHNWGKGVCGVREIAAGGDGLLVRLFEGVVFTASATLGLRAWRLHTDQLLAQAPLYSNNAPFSRVGVPTALAVDEEGGEKVGQLAVAVGFGCGAFSVYQLDFSKETFRARYVHAPEGTTAITAMAFLGPYLSTMIGQTWDIHEFSSPDHDDNSAPTPKLLSSLRSITAWPPTTLSLRHSPNNMLLATIAYSTPQYPSGWSVGLQELRFTINPATTLQGSRITSSVPSGFLPAGVPAQGGRALLPPTSMSYCHPYLITAHADNTLTLYLIRSTGAALHIDAGTRLWGHTASVAAVLVDSRGKGVSLDRTGQELRVWELEGGVSKRRRVSASVRVNGSGGGQNDNNSNNHGGCLGGFDEERVVVQRGSAIVVYDFAQ